jgi:hypothetical protein
LSAVVIERCEATLKLGLLGRRQLHLVVIQAVPKLRDPCKPFVRGQPGDFVMQLVLLAAEAVIPAAQSRFNYCARSEGRQRGAAALVRSRSGDSFVV